MTFELKFNDIFSTKRRTFLGAGPMSLRVTDSIISLANKYKKPIAMIPSRRQVDAAHLGGGYVENWTTEQFSRYVRSRDAGGFILLSRDHSGPWQLSPLSSDGNVMGHKTAMDEVKESLLVDLKCGFDLIHIDPSRGLEFGRSQSQVEDDILELLDFCQRKARSPIEYEVGADEQSQVPDLVQTAEDSLVRVLKRVKKEGLQSPMFYVLQTGTKVMEMRNIGSFDSEVEVEGMLPASVQLPEILRMCRRHGVFLKEHNADYLSTNAVAWHRRFGIHAANVAPEFGVAETTGLIDIAKRMNATWFIDGFSAHVLESGKWEKWMLANTKATDSEKVLIAGHYHFSDSVGKELIEKLDKDLSSRGVDMDSVLRRRVEQSIDRYLSGFGYNE